MRQLLPHVNLLLKFNAPGKVPTCEQLLVPFTVASAGEGFNLERQEFLGDVFLKFAVGLKLFVSETCDNNAIYHDEGFLTYERSKIIGNKGLFKMALKQGLPEVLKVAKTKPYLTYMPLRCSLPQDFELKLQEMEMDFQAKMPASECSDGENIEAKSKSIVEVITKAEVEEPGKKNLFSVIVHFYILIK